MLHCVGGQTVADFSKNGIVFIRTAQQSANNGVGLEN
jgi:hypothetical protein